ncbi:hypothetical protein BDV25DRAFT_84329 [Aspergillus avenaceus]|uniref:Uncharacterized protein n=1 Tax=Aspergillus avenaceus TaxID=36643 RepID=A0A5N6TES1_ASPAV|nr:hypothetical protein BDV25DRAFT_84329 [Aspergillus avenaceus]
MILLLLLSFCILGPVTPRDAAYRLLSCDTRLSPIASISILPFLSSSPFDPESSSNFLLLPRLFGIMAFPLNTYIKAIVVHGFTRIVR